MVHIVLRPETDEPDFLLGLDNSAPHLTFSAVIEHITYQWSHEVTMEIFYCLVTSQFCKVSVMHCACVCDDVGINIHCTASPMYVKHIQLCSL